MGRRDLSWMFRADALGVLALDVLELDGGVVDVEAFRQNSVHCTQDLLALRGGDVFNQRVATQRVRVRRQAPNVYVVNVDQALDSS